MSGASAIRRVLWLAFGSFAVDGFVAPLRAGNLPSTQLFHSCDRRAYVAASGSLVGFWALQGPEPARAKSIPDGQGGKAGQLADLVPIVQLQRQVEQAGTFLKAGQITDALALLRREPALRSRKSFDELFDRYSERVSAKTRAMNSAAFITYYEEVRYSDTRLEDKEPTKQALQYQRRNEAYLALDNLLAELEYLQTEASASASVDAADARKYGKEAAEALKEYLALAPQEDVEKARALAAGK
eukprot:scaffold385_cov305-Pinguiococcus_pyrenoidosus.AAC.32